MSQALAHHGRIDALINNAGICAGGFQEAFTPKDWMDLFNINVFGAQRMNRALLPHMRQNRSGVLLHISSILGRMTMPYSGPYNASKHALEALAENYRWECSSFGIDSIIVEPGGFPTDFFSRMMIPSDPDRDDSYGDKSSAPMKMWRELNEGLHNNPNADPKLVSAAVIRILDMPHGHRPLRTVVDVGRLASSIQAMNRNYDELISEFFRKSAD